MSTALEQLYQQVILDHAKTRHGYEEFAAEVAGRRLAGELVVAPGDGRGYSHQLNPTCGDEITVEVGAGGPGAPVSLRWDGQGCSISMASASVLAEMAEETSAEGMEPLIGAFKELMNSRGAIEPDEEVLGDAAAFVGVGRYPARIKCALLAWTAFEDALRQAVSTPPADGAE